MKQESPKKTIYLIDGSSFLYRAYHAMRPLNAPDGTPVQAVYGFCRMINKVVKDFQPQYLALVWDSKGKTTRHEVYTDYKATRQEAPSDLFEQKDLIQELADTINLHQVAESGVEADDLMASIAQDYAKKGYKTVIVTSDKDMRQVVTEDIFIFDPFKSEILDVEAVEKKYGFEIAKLPFYFALVGDSSDNIPGVRGIGPKGAQKLVQKFDSLEDLYANIENAGTPRTQKLLIDNKENAFLSEKLFTLHYHKTGTLLVDLEFEKDAFGKARALFERLNFKSLLKGLPALPEGPKKLFAERYGYTFVTVNTTELLDDLCEKLKRSEAFAIDTETDSLKALESKLVGLSFCCKKGTAYYVPCGHTTDELQIDCAEVVAKLGPILENSHIKKYLHHAKFDQLVLYNAGIELQGVAFDTLVAAGLLKHDGDRLGLKVLSDKYFQEEMYTFKEMVTQRKLKTFAQVPITDATDYAAADAHQTFQLVGVLQKELKKQKQEALYYDCELPLIQVLYEMERTGILLDPEVLKEIDVKVSRKLKTLIAKIADLTGKEGDELNLNSPRQIGDLLFNQIGLKPVKKTSKGTGYSTDQEVLKELAQEHPVPGLILQYRELYKLKSTYIDALPLSINPNTGRIHTTFRQTSVATGRLASTEPNLQNIPADGSNAPIREAFKAERGRRFISADYSQMELRILAHLSGDVVLKQAFEVGEDIHARTAAGLFKVAIDAVTNEQRQLAKRINFSILYGLTPYGLSRDLGISVTKAKEYIETYMAHYPGVQKWMESVVEETEKNGFVTTAFGRRRYLPGIYEKNRALYMLARRVAINTKAQGAAAEIMKLGMIELNKILQRDVPAADILLQIHDELLVSVPKDDVKQASEIIQNVLENVVKWSVPFIVSVRHGVTWHDVSK